MANKKLLNYLQHNKINFQTLKHLRTFSAKMTANAAHIKPQEMAKTLLLRVDEEYAMAVLPANYKLDLKRIKESYGVRYAELASEAEMETIFSDCKTGAMPPFGNLYNLPVLIDKDLEKDDQICFNAGNHKELFQIKYTDYKRLVHPRMANIHRRNR